MQINYVTWIHLFELIIFNIVDSVLNKILVLINISDKFIEYVYENE